MRCPPRRVLGLLSLLWGLAGCASWFGPQPGPQPGLTAFSISEKGALNLETGKEYGSLRGTFKRPDGLEGTFEALGVQAFQGQAIGAQTQMEQMRLTNQVLQALIARLPTLPIPPIVP